MKNSEKLNVFQLKYQYLAVICVNLLSLSQGYSTGWVAPSLLILRSEKSPLDGGPITLLETTLLGVLYCVGSLLGIILFSMITKRLGTITTITLLAIPSMIFWIILMASYSINVILVGQVITGIAHGGAHLCVPLFVAEIAHPRIRGMLGTILSFSTAFGTLCAYISGSYMDYAHVPLIILPVPVLFFVFMIILPETPMSLLRRNKIEAAIESITFYNNGNSEDKNGFDADVEIKKLQKALDQRKLDRQEGNWKLILNKKSLKGLGTGLGLTVIVTFSAVQVLPLYLPNIFTASKVNFDENLSLIIVGVTHLLGTTLSAVVIDSCGRRKLFGFSCALSGTALIAFGIFSYVNNRGFDTTSFFWMPVTCVSIFIFAGSGLRPLPFIYTAEILPSNIRRIGVTIVIFALISFVIIPFAILPYFMSVCPLETVMWTLGGVCMVGLIFSIFIMEETKGKNLHDDGS